MLKDINLNLASEKQFTSNVGDISKLESLIEDCEYSYFVNGDGFAKEILLDGIIVYDEVLTPDDLAHNAPALRLLNSELGNKLEIVWYNEE